MIHYLESISGLKIRNGYELYLEDTIKYFKLQEPILKEDAIKIILFINCSNSKASKSYWILRTNLNEEEYITELNKYKKKFVESAYMNTNRSVVQKKFQSINYSRGYSGWCEINNNKYFCRSQCEYIILEYLCNLYNDLYEIRMEEKIFHIDNISYKPDIFIYDKYKKLIKIIEIKDVECNDIKYKLFSDYFKKINIEFEIMSNSGLILKQNKWLQDKLKIWKINNATIFKDVSGKNNPRYGAIVTDETKKKISIKAKERFSDELYKQNFINKCPVLRGDSKPPAYKNRILNILEEIDLNTIQTFEDVIQCIELFKKKHINQKYFSCSINSLIKHFININNLLSKVYEHKENRKKNK